MGWGKLLEWGEWTEGGQPVGWLEALERESIGEDKGKPEDTGEEGMVLSRWIFLTLSFKTNRLYLET